MKMTAKAKQIQPHKPGSLIETRIKWHPDGKSATVTHVHMPQAKTGADMFGTGADMFGGPSSQDQAYSTRHEALHNVAQHAGVVSEMVDNPEPDDEAQEENDTAGVGDLSSSRQKTRPKMTNVVPLKEK